MTFFNHILPAASGAYAINAVDFDGSSTWLELTSSICSDTGTFAAWGWLYPDSVTGQFRILNNAVSGERFQLEIVNGKLAVSGRNSAGTLVLYAETNISASDWTHFAVSVDLSSSSLRHFYRDGANASPTWSTYSLSQTINFNTGKFAVGRLYNVASDYYDGSMGQICFTNSYVDLDSKISQIYSPNGFPKYQGPNGQSVTGSTPLLFLDGETGEWHTNKGSAGGLSENGTLTTSAHLPVRVS